MVDVEKLRIEVKAMERHSPLYKMLKQELSLRGNWCNRPRGNPHNAYLHMIEKKNDRR